MRAGEEKSKCSLDLPKLYSANDYVERGSKANVKGDYECAFEDCEKAVGLEPKNAAALGCRGYAYFKRGNYDYALTDFDEAIRLDSENPFYYSNRSQIYRKKGLLDNALQDLNRVIGAADNHFDYASRAEIYFEKGDYQNAAQDYTSAIRLKPEYQQHYEKRAEVYRKIGKNDLADGDEKKASELEFAEKGETKDVAGEILNGKAVSLPKPVYPPAARGARASGAVNVQVEIDEKGDVVSAKAISGHPLLRAAAEQAARQAKFKAVKAAGILTFNFTTE